MSNTKELADMMLDTLKEIYYGKSSKELAEFLQGEMKVLSFICNYTGDELTPSIICSSLEMTGGRVAGILRTLEKKEYINRARAYDDMRKIIVIPTENAKKHISAKTEHLYDILTTVIDNVGTENAVKLIESLTLWQKTYENVIESKE